MQRLREQSKGVSIVPEVSSSLDLPPSYRLVALREAGDAYAHACHVAAEAGAGTFVWVRRFDLLEMAVVLAPAEPLATARRAFYVGMIALADAVASHCPPEKALTFDWPGTLRLDGARIGGGRLGWPLRCREAAIPDWLVFSSMLIAAKVGPEEAGPTPLSTSFEDEGFDPRARENVAESFARHLLLNFNRYESDGFVPVATHYLRHLAQQYGAAHPLIGDNGDLLLQDANGTGHRRRLPIVPRLRKPSWRDPETGAVRF